jgi:hypothetical protein
VSSTTKKREREKEGEGRKKGETRKEGREGGEEEERKKKRGERKLNKNTVLQRLSMTLGIESELLAMANRSLHA